MAYSVAWSTPAGDGSKFNEKLLSGLRRFYDEQKLVDVTFKVSNPTILIPAHRLVLSAASTYFENLLCSAQDVTPFIEINDIPSDTFERMITYCYTGKTLITEDNVAEMLKAATSMQLDAAAADCVDFVFENITEYTLERAYSLERKTQCKRLQQKIQEYEIQHFKEIKGTAEFLNIDYENFRGILESNDLNVSCEEDVFAAIKRWYEHDSVSRERHLPDLIGCLRLSQFSTNFILTNIQPMPGCESLALKAIVWVSQPLARTKISLKFTGPREKISYLAVKISEDDGDIPKAILRYNKSEDKWLTYAYLDTQRDYGFRVILNDDNLILIGGVRNRPNEVARQSNEVRSWNLRTKTWNQLPALTCNRELHSVALLDGKMYVIGGVGKPTSLTSVEVFSSVGGWQTVRSMNTPRRTAAALTLNGNIFVMGGWNGKKLLNSVERYDPTTDVWTYCANMNKSYEYPGAAVHKGFIYVVGNGGTERYDPQRDEWTRICASNRGAGVACISFNNQLWAIGGWLQDCAYVYDEKNDKWMEKPRLARGGEYSCLAMPESFL